MVSAKKEVNAKEKGYELAVYELVEALKWLTDISIVLEHLKSIILMLLEDPDAVYVTGDNEEVRFSESSPILASMPNDHGKQRPGGSEQ